MNDTTRIDQLLHQEGGGPEPQQPSPNDDALVNDILSKIKQQESGGGGGEPVMSGQSNVNLTVQANPPINQQSHPPQQPQGTINDPNPNTTINQQVDPEIARTIQRQQKEVRFMDEDEDDDEDEEESVGQFELQNDVHFSLTDLIIRELRKPIIFAFLIILALLPISNQLIQKYLPFIGGSDVLTLSFKTFICTLIFYVLNKLSLF